MAALLVSRDGGSSARGRSRAPLAVALAVLSSACLEYSPHELPEDGATRDQHRKALEELATRPPGDAFRFAVFGDTQRAFGATEDLVEALNERDDLAFAVQLGDFTNNGLSFEYEAMHRVMRELRVPWFVVVGNHDLVANGRAIYERMFGPLDLAFTYGRVRFVLLDTNGREHGFPPDVPDLEWLGAQLAPDGLHDRAVVLSHAGTRDTDFREDLRPRYRQLLREGGAISMHGHAHKYMAWEEDGVPMFRADSAEHWNYLVVTVTREGFQVERVFF